MLPKIKCELSEKAMQNLRDFHSPEDKILIDENGGVRVEYPDGGINFIRPTNYGDGWNFVSEGGNYAAGYAYACGYRD